jgi:DNA mismatch repair protein MutS2
VFALELLEFPAVVERLVGATATPQGAARAAALGPSADAEEVGRRQALTAEAVSLLDEAAEPELAGAVDVAAAAERAARGGVLGPGELRDVARTVAVGLAARASVATPLLGEIAARIDPSLDALREAVARCVEEGGSDLRDSASPRLRSLRRELRTARQRIADELQRLVSSGELGDALQERFVTERGGRPVLAVRASSRDRVPGLVHDASSSGQTLFVEPFAIVERNNRLAETLAAERDEVERILRELSGHVGARADALETLVAAVGALDLAVACAMLSRAWRGADVTVRDEVRLLGARHPLLDRETAVPIDLDLNGLRALVVSGPNTGGKTVALKTLGLAALLHQSGLRPPAEEATLPVFDRVLADIGDRQSIEMSLSTFSGHLRTIVEILDGATPRSLVLLDELAAGTDPEEGSALAQALAERLALQARLTVVTTHFPALKEWASATDGVANAATAFDPETQAPLYRIAVGRAGTSRALQIAERLGLDPQVVADARARVDPMRARTEQLLAEAEAAERRAAEALEDARREAREAERSAAEAAEREEELRREIDAVRASAAEERRRALAAAERELAEGRAELRQLRDEIRAARKRERERRRTAPAEGSPAERERDRRLGAASARAARAERALRSLDEPVETTAPLAEGDPVEAPELGIRGTIARLDGGQAEVLGPGGTRIRVPLERLRPDPRGDARKELAEPPVRVRAAGRGDVSDELDVRGLRPQEAREAVRSFVDDAALAGLRQVRVVHGRGTGAVRSAVRGELATHRLVSGHESDSADGATLVHLG